MFQPTEPPDWGSLTFYLYKTNYLLWYFTWNIKDILEAILKSSLDECDFPSSSFSSCSIQYSQFLASPEDMEANLQDSSSKFLRIPLLTVVNSVAILHIIASCASFQLFWHHDIESYSSGKPAWLEILNVLYAVSYQIFMVKNDRNTSIDV